MTKETIKKILLSLAAVLVSALVIFILLILHSLPSPSQIASVLKKNSKPLMPTPISGVADVSAIPTDTSNPGTETTETKATATAVETQNQEKEAAIKNTILSLINEDPKDLRVCENLGQKQLTEDLNEGKPFNFEKILADTDRKNPMVEAYRVPLRAAFQEPHVAALFREIMTIQDQHLAESEKQSFLDKMGFYSRVTLAGAHLFQKKAELEELGNRAEHLGLIAHIVALRPEMASDSRLQDFCHQLEASVAQGQRLSVVDERAEVLRLIDYAGLTPQQLNFDPNSYIKFSVRASKSSFEFSLSDKPESP